MFGYQWLIVLFNQDWPSLDGFKMTSGNVVDTHDGYGAGLCLEAWEVDSQKNNNNNLLIDT